MTYENDPPRLRASGDPSDPFIRALDAARMELPTVGDLEALAARLPAMSGASGLGAGPFTRTRLRAKSVQAGLFALAAAVGVGATMKYEGTFPFNKPSRAPEVSVPSRPTAPPPAPRRAEVTGQAAPSAAPPAIAAPLPPGPVESRPRSAPSGVKGPAHDVPSSAAPSQGDLPASDMDGVRNPAAESTLLGRAQQALSSDPAQAFALTERHRREYPAGALGQESDLIAIEALVALGRTGEAEALATRFRARYPSSAHLRRLDMLIGESAPREQ